MSSNCFGKMYCFCKGSLEVVPHVYDNGQKYGSRYGLNRVWELYTYPQLRSEAISGLYMPTANMVHKNERGLAYKGNYRPNFSSARLSHYMRSETLKVGEIKEERVNENVEQRDAREEVESGKKIGEEEQLDNRRGNEKDERLGVAEEIELDRREILRLMIENAMEKQSQIID